MDQFIAQILAKLDTRQAEADLKSITDKKYQIDVELNLTNKSLDVSKILSGLESSFKTSGQNIGKSFNAGLQSGMSASKFDGNTYIKNYLDGLKRDQKEAESVAKEFTVSQNNALKAVKSRNSAETKANNENIKQQQQQQKELEAIEKARLKSIEDSKKREEKIILNQNKVINKQLESDYKQQQKEQQKLTEQNLKQISKSEQNSKKIQAQQRIAELQNNAIQKNAHTNELVNQGKSNIEKWKQQYQDQSKYIEKINELNARSEKISNTFSDDSFKQKYGNTSGYSKVIDNLEKVKTLQSEVNAEIEKGSSADFNKVNNGLKEMNSLISKSETQYSNLSKPIGALDATIASNKTLNWLNENSKATKELGDAFEDLARKQKSATTSGELESYNKQFNNLVNIAKQKGLTGKSLFAEGKRAFTQIAEFTGMYGLAQNLIQDLPREMVNNVIQLDDSLIELQKVSDLAGTSLDNFVKKAYDASSEVARTGREVIDATTTFKKAGYTLDESFNLSKTAMVMMNVGDGIDSVDEASSALIATLKGFQLSDSSAMDVVSMINETSNTSAIDFDNITEGLRRVSGTLNQAGTSIQQTIGLITGGFSQLRNIETVSNGLITISQRLRGISSDGEDLDPKLGEKFASIGVQIENADGSLRSTYEILQDYAKVYNSLTDKEQQYYAELAAGKPNVKTFNAIVQQWADVESATNAAMNSQGSAEAENEKVLQGISSRIAAFKSAFEQLSQTTVNSDFLKGIVDAGTTILKVIDTIIDKFGILQTVIGGFAVGKGITSFVKGFDRPTCIAS